jgi:hypothetical protein
MRANPRMSRVLDEHRFDALAASMVADPCADGVLWTSALATNIADGEKLSAAEQLHLLAALAVKAEADKAHADAVTQENEQLRRALYTRDIIGQAKGMLMERCDVNAAAAFNLLVTQSQKSNTRLEELARKLIETAHPD